MHRQGSSASTVTTRRPPQRDESSSRYRLGIASRPLASRLTALAPRNIDASPLRLAGHALITHFLPLCTTCAHYRNATCPASRRAKAEKALIDGNLGMDGKI